MSKSESETISSGELETTFFQQEYPLILYVSWFLFVSLCTNISFGFGFKNSSNNKQRNREKNPRIILLRYAMLSSVFAEGLCPLDGSYSSVACASDSHSW